MTVFFVVIVVAAFAAHRNVLRGGLLTLGNTDDVEILNAVNDVVTGDNVATVHAAEFHFGFDALRTQDGCHFILIENAGSSLRFRQGGDEGNDLSRSSRFAAWK